MVARLVSGSVAVVATAYLVVLVFPWTEGEDGELAVGKVTGLDLSPSFFSFNTGLALLLWEPSGSPEYAERLEPTRWSRSSWPQAQR